MSAAGAAQLSPRQRAEPAGAAGGAGDAASAGDAAGAAAGGRAAAGQRASSARAGGGISGGGASGIGGGGAGGSRPPPVLDMPSEAKLWRGLLLFTVGSLALAIVIRSGVLSVLGLSFHLQSPAALALALAVLMVLCMSLYCVYCST